MFVLTIATPVVVSIREFVAFRAEKPTPTAWETLTSEFEFETLAEACEMARRSLARGVKVAIVNETTGETVFSNAAITIPTAKKSLRELAKTAPAVTPEPETAPAVEEPALPRIERTEGAQPVSPDALQASGWGRRPGQLRIITTAAKETTHAVDPEATTDAPQDCPKRVQQAERRRAGGVAGHHHLGPRRAGDEDRRGSFHEPASPRLGAVREGRDQAGRPSEPDGGRVPRIQGPWRGSG